MLFNSFKFLLFFPIVTIVYYLMKKEKLKIFWLLICSYIFYMCYNPIYALLLLSSTIVTYTSGLLMANKKNKKLFLIASLVINLFILFVFKYYNFTIENINSLLNVFGLNSVNKFDILLPIGISFYTFQALSYSIDVYRNDVAVEKNFIKYALFVSFFPQLLAGPIQKSKEFLKQFNLEKKANFEDIRFGLLVMLLGYFQKLVIADRAAILVNNVYDNVSKFKGVPLILATVLFAFQIYYDFYSYSLIATGSARVLGYKLSNNFDTPYLSTSIKEFWRRWHISLSSWFKEYLYFPLGGSRTSVIGNIRNILIVFLISGLWHGASWTFIVWGALHGIYQVISIIYRLLFKKSNISKKEKIYIKLLKIIFTFVLVDFAWIFFRANNINDAFYIVKNIINLSSNFNVLNLGLDKWNIVILFVSIFLMLTFETLKNKLNIYNWIAKNNIVIRWLIYYIIIFVILIFGVYGPGYDASQFIYFKF